MGFMECPAIGLYATMGRYAAKPPRHAQFFIFGLPRSRTLWAANLLTWGAAHCYHELEADACDEKSFRSRMGSADGARKYIGNSGSGNFLFHERIFEWFPDASMVFLWRDPDDVQRSLTRLKQPLLPEQIFCHGHFVMEHIRRMGGLVIESIEDPDISRKLWDHCIPEIPYPKERNRQLEFTRSEITEDRWKHFDAAKGKWPFNV
jgi:hypothetical protein